MFDDDAKPGRSFDLNDSKVKAYKSPIPESGPENDKPVKANKLDSEPMVELFHKLMTYYVQELDRQAENRHEMAVDEDFYDNIQWTQEDAQTLKDRGQMPLVYNVISTSLNWVIGSEKTRSN